MREFSSEYAHPLIDETFSSWLYRCSKSYSALGVTTEDLSRWFYQIDKKSDYDFDLNSTRVSVVLSELKIDKNIILNLFCARSEFLLHQHYRKAYCPLCLNGDVAAGMLPYWRKEWCYCYTTHCPIHGLLLSSTSAKDALSKAWFAFSEDAELIVNSPSRFSSYGWRLNASDRDCPLNSLSMRVQEWLKGLHMDVFCSFPNGESFKADEVLSVCTIFLGLLLYLNKPSRGLGAARYFFNRSPYSRLAVDLEYLDAMERGAKSGTPYQRMIALLFLGWIFHLINDDEIQGLVSLHRDGRNSWPISRLALGGLSPAFRHDKEYGKFRAKFFNTPMALLKYVESYLSGVPCPYAQHRRSLEERFILREYGHTLARWKYSDIRY